VKFSRLPHGLEADHRALVGAAVDQRVDAVLGVADDDHRGVADLGGLERAGVRQLGLERQEVPGRAAEDALLLTAIDRGVGEHRVGHAADAFVRPSEEIRTVVH